MSEQRDSRRLSNANEPNNITTQLPNIILIEYNNPQSYIIRTAKDTQTFESQGKTAICKHLPACFDFV